MTTRGQPRLRLAARTRAELGALLPPSGHPEHWALGGRDSTLFNTTAPSLPLLSWDVCARVHSAAGILQPRAGEEQDPWAWSSPLPHPTHLQIAGVHFHPLPDLPQGTLDLNELERMITRGLGSPYHPVCELICLENTHNSSGGRVLSIDYLRQVGGAPLPGFGRSDTCSGCPPVARTAVGGPCADLGCRGKGNDCPRLGRAPAWAWPLAPARRLGTGHRLTPQTCSWLRATPSWGCGAAQIG